MSFDAHRNFALTTLAAGINSSATSLMVATGSAVSRLPVAPFNATLWNSTDYPNPALDPLREIVRVTAISTDTLTITRGQEGTTASAHNVTGKTYSLQAGPTAKTFTDIEAASAAEGAFSFADLFTRYPLFVPIRNFLSAFKDYGSGQPPCGAWIDGDTIHYQGILGQTTPTSVAYDDPIYLLPNGFEPPANQGRFGPSALFKTPAYTPVNYFLNPGWNGGSPNAIFKFPVGTFGVGEGFGFAGNDISFINPGYISGGLGKTFTGPNDSASVIFPSPLPVNTSGLKVVMYFHGAGGDDCTSHLASVSNTQVSIRATILALLAAGWTVISSNGGPVLEHWGNPTSFQATTAALDWLKSIVNVTKLTALGQSMGGLSSARAAGFYPGLTKWYSVASCLNLDWLYLNQSSFTASMNTAYGSSNHSQFLAASSGCDPMTFDPSVFVNVDIKLRASYSDTTVDRVNNTDAFATLVTGHAKSIVVTTSTGGHGDPSGFVASEIVNFLDS